MSSQRVLARKRSDANAFRSEKVWGHTDSNREPSSYEPPALTVELCPRFHELKSIFELSGNSFHDLSFRD
jgi:hypothetical protein